MRFAARDSRGVAPPGLVRVLVALGLVVILPTACAGQPLTTVMDKDNNGQVQVPLGGMLVVRLDAILGTGYGWELATVNREVLEPSGPPTIEPTGTPQPGGVEKQVFRFRTLKAGSTSLELYYRRPWEKDVPPQKTFRLRVEAR